MAVLPGEEPQHPGRVHHGSDRDPEVREDGRRVALLTSNYVAVVEVGIQKGQDVQGLFFRVDGADLETGEETYLVARRPRAATPSRSPVARGY